MVQPIGAPNSPRIAPVQPQSATGLQAELARLQGVLAACVNCAAAETTQGKAEIQEVSNKINAIKARIENLTRTPKPEPPPPPSENIASPLGSILDLST